tara:strand:+ start:394 stop:1527 length:1134 start_codon:yes stop_codon:yes gene_type:complete
MKLSMPKLQQIIEEEIQKELQEKSTRLTEEETTYDDAYFDRLMKELEAAPKKPETPKKTQTRRKTRTRRKPRTSKKTRTRRKARPSKKGKKAPAAKKGSQLTQQLDYLRQHKRAAGINETFLIVDDKKHLMYVYSEDFKLLKRFPIITGENTGEVDTFNFTDWLRDNNMFGTYKKAIKNMKSKNSAEKKNGKRVKNQLFNAFLNERGKTKQKITPSGVFTISKIKGQEEIEDQVNYGLAKFSLATGIDPVVPGTGNTIAIHGTGNKGRIKALNQAQKLVDKGYYNVAPVLIKKPSYGCVNLRNDNAVALARLIEPGSQVFILPEDGSIVEVGTFQRFTQELGNATKLPGKCVQKVVDFFGDAPAVPKELIDKSFKIS